MDEKEMVRTGAKKLAERLTEFKTDWEEVETLFNTEIELEDGNIKMKFDALDDLMAKNIIELTNKHKLLFCINNDGIIEIF